MKHTTSTAAALQLQQCDIDAVTAALWQEIDATDWTQTPYVGLQSAVAHRMQISRQAIGQGIRRRNIEVGIALITLKRNLEREINAALAYSGERKP